jgi:endonuclease/exonuclease/phosphatase family metal-dependent hydrolase
LTIVADGPRLRVMSYNVHGLRDDLAALAKTIRTAAPDVVILQEAPRRFRWRTRSAILADALGLVVGGGGLPALGNLVLTNLRVRVHEEWCLQFPLTPGRHMRGAAFVRCSVPGTPFVVAGSHLATDPGERPGQATILKKTLADVDVPVILGVDVNEGSTGGAWRTLADGLVDAAVATGRTAVPTYPVAGPRDRLDAVFVDPRCTVVGYEVPDSAEVRRASDHFPIVVDVALPAQPD